MNPPVINSTSSVSTTKRKREAERSVNWTAEETQVLLCAWSDERIQRSLAENLRNRHVFKHLSARMSEMGFARSPHQCRLRVKTLKANYVRAKLQRSVDGSPPCTFRYFAEMEAVLGRRAAGGVAEGAGLQYFVSPERMAAPDAGYDNTEVGERRSGSSPGGRRSWPMDAVVKMEDGEDSTDEYEFSNSGFTQRHDDVYLEASIRREMTGAVIENCLSPPSPQAPPPPAAPPSPPLTHSASSPLPAPSDLPLSPSAPPPPPPRSSYSCLERLSEGFERLSADTRRLLLQLEGQRQEAQRWHQDLLAQWLQREERQQSEAAEREERREKARMEHELRVLELLAGLVGEPRCRCGGGHAHSPEEKGGS